jgi:dipeptidyl-peptidase-4
MRKGLHHKRNDKHAIIVVFTILFTAVVLAGRAAAQEKVDAQEMLRKIYQTNEFSGGRGGAGGGQWVDGGAGYIRMEPSAEVKGGRDIVRYETATGKREVLVGAAELIPAPGAGRRAPAAGSGEKPRAGETPARPAGETPALQNPLQIERSYWSKDKKKLLIYTNSKRVWRTNTRGDYWVLDREAKTLKKLGGTAPESSLMFAKFSPDATQVAYVRENNLYVEELKSGKITQLTKDGTSPTLSAQNRGGQGWATQIVNGGTDWVYEEEFGIADGFRWRPDGKMIAFLHFDTSGVPVFPLVYDLGVARQVVTGVPYDKVGVYPVIEEVPWPQAGTTNSAVKVGVVNVAKKKITWMQVTGDARDNYIARLEWAGNDVFMQHLNRLQNAEEYLLGNPQTGAVRVAFKDEDPAWVDVEDVRFLKDGAEFLTLSEKDGWRHAYVVKSPVAGRQSPEPKAQGRDALATAGGTPALQLVTSGELDVIRVAEVDEKGGWLYILASPENATQRYLYRARLDGSGRPERITPADQPGSHTYQISPDCQWAFHTYSRFDVPPVSELIRLPEHTVARVMDDGSAMKAKIAAFANPPVEFFQVDIGDGIKMDGWLVKPPNFDPAKKYPILFHVYGEPASQTVLDSWSSSGWLFTRLLASQGYLVASFDNRGSPAARGRAWRKAIYGKIGSIMVHDQTAAVKELERMRPYVDPQRVAVWGWSGGGSSTLNLMFRSPEVYQVGMAVAPVPDQRLYDSIYQERYMGLPQKTPENYKDGSPIEFAAGLKGHLLLVHGSGDDNVHYQGSELLVNRMIELGKQFDFMSYPQRTHGISEGRGTTYHVYSLLYRYLTEHVEAGGK